MIADSDTSLRDDGFWEPEWELFLYAAECLDWYHDWPYG